jgi:hypothetical protein
MPTNAVTRVMIVLDTYRVSSPARGVLDFCVAPRGRAEPRLVVFQRGGGEPTEVREECVRLGLHMDVPWERFRFDPRVLIRARRVARLFCPDVVETNACTGRTWWGSLCSAGSVSRGWR